MKNKELSILIKRQFRWGANGVYVAIAEAIEGSHPKADQAALLLREAGQERLKIEFPWVNNPRSRR
jgi:hypothetical protein